MNASRRRFLKGVAASGVFLSMPKAKHALIEFHSFNEDVPLEQIGGDPLRPQFHLLPARNWMNDPNGPIFWKDNHHMFFQYNPNAAVWGDMHWAHAISNDMIHWKHMPVALAPTSGGYDQEGCFSGSAVDNRGTATLLYTGVTKAPAEQVAPRNGNQDFVEVQCLATSTDTNLRTWKKLSEPVLFPPDDSRLTGFLDPCLWRAGNLWFMGIGSGIRGEGGRVLLYRSEDLRNWTYLHPLASGKRNDKQTDDAVESGEMWECPDFFPLGTKHVLLYSTERKVYWQSGELDPKEMVFHVEKRGLLDHGAYYAPKSQLDAKGRRILWGWITETRPEAELRAAGWAGCMSLPRVLTLDERGALQMSVVPELAQLRETEMSVAFSSASGKNVQQVLSGIELKSASAEIEVSLKAKRVRLRISDSTQSIFAVTVDPAHKGQELQIGEAAIDFPLEDNAPHRLQIFLDGSVVECFLDERLAWTSRTYRAARTDLHIQIPDEDIPGLDSLRVWPLRAISPDRLTT
jgi:beta-fructofuranosidase